MNPVNPQENQIKINGLDINYKMIGSGDVPIVLLHGWGISSDKYLETVDALLIQTTNYKLQTRIFIPDLPGFGKSEEPSENWNLDNYVEFVNEFVDRVVSKEKRFEQIKNIISNIESIGISFLKLGQKSSSQETGVNDIEKKSPNPLYEKGNNLFLNYKKIILIGHSFGGRIAIKYAVKYSEKIEKLILTGAAGIKHPLTLKQKLFYILAKIGKKVFSLLEEAKLPIGSLASECAQKLLYKAAREKDYFSASPKMKEIMKNIIIEDLTPILNQINIPTLLLWGRDDHSTPLSDGKIMNGKIENSKLEIIDNANHSLPYQKPKEFAETVLKFIK